MIRKLVIVQLLLLLGILAPASRAQTAVHTTTLTWTASPSPSAGYNVYLQRDNAQCAGPFVKANTAVLTATTFVDSGMADGTISCYYVTAVAGAVTGGAESAQTDFFIATTPSTKTAPPPPPVVQPASGLSAKSN